MCQILLQQLLFQGTLVVNTLEKTWALLCSIIEEDLPHSKEVSKPLAGSVLTVLIGLAPSTLPVYHHVLELPTVGMCKVVQMSVCLVATHPAAMSG